MSIYAGKELFCLEKYFPSVGCSVLRLKMGHIYNFTPSVCLHDLHKSDRIFPWLYQLKIVLYSSIYLMDVKHYLPVKNFRHEKGGNFLSCIHQI